MASIIGPRIAISALSVGTTMQCEHETWHGSQVLVNVFPKYPSGHVEEQMVESGCKKYPVVQPEH